MLLEKFFEKNFSYYDFCKNFFLPIDYLIDRQNATIIQKRLKLEENDLENIKELTLNIYCKDIDKKLILKIILKQKQILNISLIIGIIIKKRGC